MQSALLIAFIVYLLIILSIGLYASYFQPTVGSSDVISGNRRINWWVTAISAHAADMSDWLFMALPALAYLQGGMSVWVAIGLVFGMFISWHFLAPQLRAVTARHGSKTLASFFEMAHNERRGYISLVSAIIMAFFFTMYVAAGIKGVGYLLSSTFGLPGLVAGALTLAIVLSYTMVGGFVAAAWVDFFQGIFLLVAILGTALAGYFSVGGASAIFQAAATKGVSLKLVPSWSAAVQIILDPIAWGLGYFGMPHILAKFMGAHDVRQMYKSKYIGLTWQILALSGAILVGFVGIAFFAQPLINAEKNLFIVMTLQLFPSFVAGLILCGILSATLSTMNSQLLVLGGVCAEDLFKRWYKKDASEKHVLTVFRFSILTIALLSFAIAWFDQGSIFNLVKFAWGGLGASFGPLTIVSLHSTKINRHGALYGILAGGITALLWKIAEPQIAGFQINEVLPGFIVGIAVIYCVSCLTRHSR